MISLKIPVYLRALEVKGFKDFLNWVTLETVFMSLGMLFQIKGAWYEKDRSPNVLVYNEAFQANLFGWSEEREMEYMA